MARYSSNLGDKLQIIVGIGKEYGFTRQNGVTAENGEQPIRLPNDLLYPRVEVEQRTHSGVGTRLPKIVLCE